MGDCPSRLKLAQKLTGELAEAERRELEQHLRDCSRCCAALAQLSQQAEAYATALPQGLARLRAQLAQTRPARLQGLGRRRQTVMGVVAAAAAAACALVVVYVRQDGPVERAERPQSRYLAYRGSFTVQVVAKRGEQQFMVDEQTAVQAADALRFVVMTDTPGYIVVFSLDGRHHLTPFYPDSQAERDRQPYPLPRAGRHVLPGSVVLDDAPGPERLVVLFAPTRYDRLKAQQLVARELRQKSAISPEALRGLHPRAQARLLVASKQPRVRPAAGKP